MSNELIPMDVLGEVSTQVGSDEDFAALSTGGFLQRIELKSKGKLIDKRIVLPGHYAVIKSADDAVDLGDSIDIMPLARRMKAIDMSDNAHIVVSYDCNSDLFKDIEERSAVQNSHCQFGASLLVIERSTGKLYELFLGSKSHRKIGAEIMYHLPVSAADIATAEANGNEPRATEPRSALPVTLKSKNKTNEEKGYSWFVIVPTPCSNPFSKSQVPNLDKIREEGAKFINPDDGNKPEVETTKAGGKKKRAR